MLAAKTASAKVVRPLCAFIISGDAAIAAIRQAIKCVMALPGSLIVNCIRYSSFTCTPETVSASANAEHSEGIVTIQTIIHRVGQNVM